jgi:hypothetical protein
MSYILTRNALLIDLSGNVINAKRRKEFLHLIFDSKTGKGPLNINHSESIDMFSQLGIRITIIVKPIFITASTLTGVISIPVPEPDELPF